MSTVTVSSPRLIANGCGAWSDTYNSIEDAMHDLDEVAWNARNGGADGSMLANLWTLAEYCEEYVQGDLEDQVLPEYPRGTPTTTSSTSSVSPVRSNSLPSTDLMPRWLYAKVK